MDEDLTIEEEAGLFPIPLFPQGCRMEPGRTSAETGQAWARFSGARIGGSCEEVFKEAAGRGYSSGGWGSSPPSVRTWTGFWIPGGAWVARWIFCSRSATSRRAFSSSCFFSSMAFSPASSLRLYRRSLLDRYWWGFHSARGIFRCLPRLLRLYPPCLVRPAVRRPGRLRPCGRGHAQRVCRHRAAVRGGASWRGVRPVASWRGKGQPAGGLCRYLRS